MEDFKKFHITALDGLMDSLPETLLPAKVFVVGSSMVRSSWGRASTCAGGKTCAGRVGCALARFKW